MAATRTTCPYCGVGCGIVATVEGERQVAIAGDKDHPANRGKLCSKGTHLGETVGFEGRLLAPQVDGVETGWDAALDAVADRMRTTIAEHGPDSVAFYVSGQLLTEDYYVANKLAKGFVGTGNIDTNSRLCMASAVAAHNRAFGEDVVPCSYDELDAADLIILVGSNTAWCHPVVWQRIEAAREARGTKLVVIDPRRTETAAMADLHVQVSPDGDVALFNALLAESARWGALNEGFLHAKCTVPAGYIDKLDGSAHGIDDKVFGQLAELFLAHPRTITLFSQGANQSVGGTDKCNAIINLHLATGRINSSGAGPFSITGQPNAMGGREVGGLANMLACHLGFSEDELAAVRDFWGAPNLCSGPGLKAVDMFRAVYEGRIRFLWVMATNPAVSMPDAGFVREALERCPTVVVSDVIANTDTARFANILLPALAWGEKDGTVTNSERRISRQRALMPPPGGARADWQIICDVAARLGYKDAFAFPHAAAIFREYAAMSGLAVNAGKVFDLTEWASHSDDAYDSMTPFQWGGAFPLAERFSTPDGKARIIPVQPPACHKLAEGELRLNTGRYRDHWHTMTRTGLSPKLSQHRREPLLEIAPADADARNIVDGGWAKVESKFGSTIYRVLVSESQAPGEVFAPIHFTDANSGGGRTGLLVHPLTDPVSGQPGFKNVPVRATPYRPGWRAFLLSCDPIQVTSAYWSSARINGGWLTELAGDGTIDLDVLLPPGDRQDVNDKSRGMLRVAVRDDASELSALLFLTRTGTLPARDWVERQFAAPDASAVELLAGRPSTPPPDRGALVCVCHDVGEKAIVAAAQAGADSVKAIGAVTCAGTNCGSCRPLISRILERCELPLQEAAQ